MRPTFSRIDPERRRRLEDAAFAEFAARGYEGGSLDRIVETMGISKGGLYEYIESKAALFEYLVGLAWDGLYDFLEERIGALDGAFPDDVLQRFRLVAGLAIDHYLADPVRIRFLVRAGDVSEPALKRRVEEAFQARFLALFGDAGPPDLRIERSRLLSMLAWLLARTRRDFLGALDAGAPPGVVRREYLAEWDFFLDVLRDGIYQKRR